jgi:ComF family protein
MPRLLYTGSLDGGEVFPSRCPEAVLEAIATVRRAASGFLALVFPEDCRVCENLLSGISRVPVCDSCLKEPSPLLADYFCVACRTPFQNPRPLDESGRCAMCRRSLTGFDAAYCYGAYEGTLRKLIHLFKYGRIHPLARPLADFLVLALPRDQRFDAIVPMPLHWWRKLRRGFNQSELLAREVARRTGLPLRALVKRRRYTATQAGLTNAGRRANVTGAFRVSRRDSVRGLRILLIDDVMTTGATAGACSMALKRAGAEHVALLALARVDRRPVDFGLRPVAVRLPDSVGVF